MSHLAKAEHHQMPNMHVSRSLFRKEGLLSMLDTGEITHGRFAFLSSFKGL